MLFLVVGYIYFLPLIGKEPIGWKVSYPVRLFLLFIAMPVDAFTGVVLGSETADPFTAFSAPRAWGPTPVEDIHLGGAVMWIGGAAIMFVLILATFFAWSRETRPIAGMGWLESGAAGEPGDGDQRGPGRRRPGRGRRPLVRSSATPPTWTPMRHPSTPTTPTSPALNDPAGHGRLVATVPPAANPLSPVDRNR